MTAPKSYKGPWYEYSTTSTCSGQDIRPGQGGSDLLCQAAVDACAGTGATEMRVWRRQVDRTGKPIHNTVGAWELLGRTCLPDLVPGPRPALTLAVVRKAFRDTAFAQPTLKIQPVGLRTLVNLPTYYETVWPAAGYQPDEVNTLTLLGYQVQLRPRLASLTYHYGDGTSSPPTTSLGGPYPDGDIQHTYTRRGTLPVNVTAVYGASFRVGTGEWVEIPDTVTVTGPTSTLQVLEARARLYTR